MDIHSFNGERYNISWWSCDVSNDILLKWLTEYHFAAMLSSLCSSSLLLCLNIALLLLQNCSIFLYIPAALLVACPLQNSGSWIIWANRPASLDRSGLGILALCTEEGHTPIHPYTPIRQSWMVAKGYGGDRRGGVFLRGTSPRFSRGRRAASS